MEDTIYTEAQIVKIVAAIRRDEKIERIDNYLDYLKAFPDPEIALIAKQYPGDNWDLINDLEGCPRFEELMEQPWEED